MAKNEGIPINPAVLKWARIDSGYSLEELSSISTFKNFAEWENGSKLPTYPQLEKIAKKFHRTTAFFFFPSPPEDEGIEKSLRALSQESINELSPRIRYLFRKAKAFQFSLKELVGSDLIDQKSKIDNLYKFSPKNDEIIDVDRIIKIARDVRSYFNVPLEVQTRWKDSSTALKEWRKIFANKGIFVFKEAFKDESIGGFCIYDDLFPIIFLNNQHSKNRQIFTLFHELAHILLKTTYLDVYDEKFWRLETAQPNHLEVKCNAFAGEFLVPTQELSQDISTSQFKDLNINALADKYHVSKDVILRRLLTIKHIDKSTYANHVSNWKNFLQNTDLTKPKKKGKQSGNYYNNQIAYLGESYLGLVIERYGSGAITIEQAAFHLDVNSKSFPDIEQNFMLREVKNVRF